MPNIDSNLTQIYRRRGKSTYHLPISIFNLQVEWWTRTRHLQILTVAFNGMDKESWEFFPSSTNAVESHNRLSIPSHHGRASLMRQLEHQYRQDKLVTQRHVASERSIAMKSRQITARRARFNDSAERDGPPDTHASFGKRKLGDSLRKKTKSKFINKLVSVALQDESEEMTTWIDGFVNDHSKEKGYEIMLSKQELEPVYVKKIPSFSVKLL